MRGLAKAVEQLASGQTVYLPGATGEALGLAAALAANPERLSGVRVVGCFVPGMNSIDYVGLHPEARLTTVMLPPKMRGSFEAGRVQVVPATYRMAARIFQGMPFDLAFAQVAPPDARGRCSLGIASDFAPLVWPRARRRILLVNPAMPAMPGAPSLDIADADLVVDADGPLVTVAESPSGETEAAIARHVAQLVPDHAVIQTGIGAVPSAAMKALTDHKGLVLRSGYVPNAFRDLAQAGALDDGAEHIAGIAYGDLDLYHFLAENGLVQFLPVDRTHCTPTLSQLPRYTAINSAREVDLLGRANVSWHGRKLFGGVGGLPDFARAAVASSGGRSIIALPATAQRGSISRIVALLGASTCDLVGSEIDTVVTEHGIADVTGKNLDHRAEALIAIAAPEFRNGLEQDWADMRRSM